MLCYLLIYNQNANIFLLPLFHYRFFFLLRIIILYFLYLNSLKSVIMYLNQLMLLIQLYQNFLFLFRLNFHFLRLLLEKFFACSKNSHFLTDFSNKCTSFIPIIDNGIPGNPAPLPKSAILIL